MNLINLDEPYLSCLGCNKNTATLVEFGGDDDGTQICLECLEKGVALIKESGWITLGELRQGAVFETKAGVRAMKTEYHTFNGGIQCDCYLLESGEAAHFPALDNELVREIVVP